MRCPVRATFALTWISFIFELSIIHDKPAVVPAKAGTQQGKMHFV